LRLGCGAGFSADRLDPARDLAARGGLDYLIFECLGERTLAFGHRDRMLDPSKGYNKLLAARLRAVLPLCRRSETTVISNMGAANPRAAAEVIADVARELDLRGLRIATVEGDDVTDLVTAAWELPEIGRTVGEVGLPVVGANAYIGVDALMPALAAEAVVVNTGRVADPSLFLAPAAHRFGWRLDDWPRLGAGTLVGHLMECAAQVTGGYFADPGIKDVEDLAYVGFPIAEVAADGRAVITKLADTGGCVSERTVKEQLLYEVHDPTRYLTPDVTADFSAVRVASDGPDRVQVCGAGGRPRPERLKVTVGFEGGYLAEAGISYAGPGAPARARLAGDIVRERMVNLHAYKGPLRVDLIGINALHATAVTPATDGHDVRVRAALRTSDRDQAETLLWEVESLLCCGPAGGGGYRGTVVPSVVTHSAFIERERVVTKVSVFET
jgi:hypothetical protein